ncbi:MAG TPA: SPOR domain-containing protein [Alphaproteobacteria bacterium]
MGRNISRTLTALLMATGGLAGCAEPLSMTVAPNAFDGFSYATEGKSVSDMAISQVSDRDCALWRVVEDKPICRDYTLKERRDMAVARMESDRYDRRRNRVNEPDLYVPEREPRPILVAQAQEAQARLDAAEGKGTDHVPVASAGSGAGLPSTPNTSGSGASGWGATLQPAAYTPHPAGKVPAKADGAYLVLGSYSSRENADAARSRYVGEPTSVDSVAARGGAIYRVVSGPYAPGELTAAKPRLAQSYGIRNAWTLRNRTPATVPASAPSTPPTPRTAPVVAQLTSLHSID